MNFIYLVDYRKLYEQYLDAVFVAINRQFYSKSVKCYFVDVVMTLCCGQLQWSVWDGCIPGNQNGWNFFAHTLSDTVFNLC